VQHINTDVVVVGAGLAGLTAAIALAEAGTSCVLLGHTSSDNRTTALLSSSVTALDTLGVWLRCRHQAAPLKVMRIVDATGRLLRAPETRFVSEEIGLDAFAWNIENQHLTAALAATAQDRGVRHVTQEARAIEIGEANVRVALAGGDDITARLVIGADGRHSLCRAAAGIETDHHRYPQTAVTFNLAHSRPHRDTSTEFHTEHGPFTLVPLPGRRSSLVWVMDPAEARRVGARDDAELNDEIEQRSHSILGKIVIEPSRGAFPLGMDVAQNFAAHRVALAGEAAHTLPPIGAQGFNLGLRDVATIAELVAAARRDGTDIGESTVTNAYDRQRRADVMARQVAVDLLNRSLLSDFLPVQGARGLGLYLMDHVGPLRRAVMREGVMPTMSMPRLMRGEAL
jgi:2-octaprenyl-6-methoxyphenol hydroxylase